MRDKLIMQAIELREKAKEMKNIADTVLKGIACSKDMPNSESLNVLFSDKQKDKAREKETAANAHSSQVYCTVAASHDGVHQAHRTLQQVP